MKDMNKDTNKDWTLAEMRARYRAIQKVDKEMTDEIDDMRRELIMCDVALTAERGIITWYDGDRTHTIDLGISSAKTYHAYISSGGYTGWLLYMILRGIAYGDVMGYAEGYGKAVYERVLLATYNRVEVINHGNQD